MAFDFINYFYIRLHNSSYVIAATAAAAAAMTSNFLPYYSKMSCRTSFFILDQFLLKGVINL